MKLFLLLLPLLGFSQLHHQTIGVGGGSSNNGIVFSVGQASVVGNHFSQGYSITQGFVQPFSKSNFAIFWGPTGTTDTILFLLEVYGQDGGYDTVTCLTTDSGGLGLDPTLLSAFSAEDLLILSLYRMQLTGAIHPDNGSTVEAVSAIGVIGTGYLIE